ncbi:DUF5372 family protein [Neorhodopirellula pilleata]|uniref:DUF5372 family protein n=1 Tax=Neorhodopirellula pilleata TaxID=2714738 RepID=UPI0036F41E94
MGKRDRSASRHNQLKAHSCSQPSGNAEITHPFHPLLGKRFPILKTRTVSGVESVILKGSESGTFSVPRQWTSIRSTDCYEDAEVPPTILRLERLIEMAALLKTLGKSVSEN